MQYNYRLDILPFLKYLMGMRTKNKLVYGVGVNDCGESVKAGGKNTTYYVIWNGMLRRCYSDKYHSARTYIGCTVCDEWLLLSNFKKWFDENYVDGIVGSGFGVDSQSNITFAMVKNYDDLRQLSGEIDVVYLSGRLTEGDGGAGLFQYTPADISTDNDGTILVNFRLSWWTGSYDIETLRWPVCRLTPTPLLDNFRPYFG